MSELAELIKVVGTAVASIVASVAAIYAMKANQKIKIVEKAANSLVDRLVATTRAEAHQAGVKEEKERPKA